MLTQHDVEQIQGILRQEMAPIMQEILLMKQEILLMKQRLEKLDTKNSTLDRKISKIDQNVSLKLDAAITYFDTITTTHEQRLRTLEKLQGLIVNDDG